MSLYLLTNDLQKNIAWVYTLA